MASTSSDEHAMNTQPGDTPRVAHIERPKQRRIPWSETLRNIVGRPKPSTEWRTVAVGCPNDHALQFPGNIITNTRYNIVTFVPLVLIDQFHSFINFYYLLVAVSQFVPFLAVGLLFTYIAPLGFVISLSMLKEAYDDMKKYRRDKRANNEAFESLVLDAQGRVVVKKIPAFAIKVGTILQLHAGDRIPADCILLRTSEKSGASFIRTDQLDGETDWKLRYPVRLTQNLDTEGDVLSTRINIECEPPHKDIYKFSARVEMAGNEPEGLNLEHTLWSNCVLASGRVMALVIHTGIETRSTMNAARPATKISRFETELNRICQLCFAFLAILALGLVAVQQFEGIWYVNILRFLILLSSILPISMRVNLDVAKMWYAFVIMMDSKIPGTVVRNSNIPEDLGRLSYLFSDKTGTLTKNKMEFRNLRLGPTFSLRHTDKEDICEALSCTYPTEESTRHHHVVGYDSNQIHQISDAILALVTCHNVTPVTDEDGVMHYQASSPDEVAMVEFAEEVKMKLMDRSLTSLSIQAINGQVIEYEILKDFPFSSERKCMGIILKNKETEEITYLMKGADVKMVSVVKHCEWLDESCQDLAVVGLRTLVFAKKSMTKQQFETFMSEFERANAVLGNQRPAAISAVLDRLESDMDLCCITGVEDQLQDDVTACLETLGMCGIRVWMLTGDKVETATCIGRSTRLIPRTAQVDVVLCSTPQEAEEKIAVMKRTLDSIKGHTSDKHSLVIDGRTLSIFLEYYEEEFVNIAREAVSVIVARCSPEQKAQVVRVVQRHEHTSVRTAAIGDGGNDVSMILAANVGIGIEGVEGKQASMAADFSITQFSHCLRLIMWHGRLSYKRSARLSQFILHRGFVISIVQTVFSLIFHGCTMSVFNAYLIMGYTTVFTMAPTFSLVLDEDHLEDDIDTFPELYKELLKARAFNVRTVLQVVWLAVYQGGMMMLLTLHFFANEMFHVVSITFTALLITELAFVATEVHLKVLWIQRRRHYWLFMGAEVFSLLCYIIAIFSLKDTFDKEFMFTADFLYKLAVICAGSIVPMGVIAIVSSVVCRPPRMQLSTSL